MYISCKAALMDKQEQGGRADSSPPSIHGLLFDEDEDGGRRREKEL